MPRRSIRRGELVFRVAGERDGKMFYENPEAGCLLSFSRLGEILLVDREGCHDMPQPCHPDGAYRKQ